MHDLLNYTKLVRLFELRLLPNSSVLFIATVFAA